MTDKVIDLWGEPVEVAISSPSTDNASCAVIQTSPPDGGTLVHEHSREDEVLTVLEGEYLFFESDSWRPMRPNRPVFARRGRPHAYRNVGKSHGRMLVVAAPGGLDLYFEAVAALSMPADQARMDDISRMYGITVLSPDPVPLPGKG